MANRTVVFTAVYRLLEIGYVTTEASCRQSLTKVNYILPFPS